MRITQGEAAVAGAKSAMVLPMIRRLFAPLALTLASVLTLSGCGLEVVGPAPSSPSASPDGPVGTQASASAASVVDVDPSATPSPSPTQDGEPTERDLARRSYYDDRIELTTACPTGRVVIDQSMRVTKITEDCKEVVVTGAFTTLLAQHIGTLKIEVTASHGHFIAASIGKADVAGAFNHIYWDSGEPALHVTGFKCVIQPNPAKEQK